MNYIKLILLIVTVYSLASCGGAEERKAVYLEKAKLSKEIGDLDKARIELKNVLQIDPKDASAYFLLGDIYDQKKEYKKAFNYYSKAVEITPENLKYHAKIGTYLLVYAGDIDAAIEKRNLILSKDETNVPGLLLSAGILFKQGDVDGSKKIAQDIFSSKPEFVQNTMFLSSLYLSDNKYDDAINVINICIKDNPTDYRLVDALANVYLKAGKNDLAEAMLRKILKKNPEVFSNYLKLAQFYMAIGDSDKSEDVIREAIKEDVDDVNRKISLAKLLQKTKGNQIAIDELKNLIKKNKDMGDLRFVLAEIYLAEKNIDEAKNLLEATVADFTEDSIGIKSRVYLASLYMQEGKTDAAINIVGDALLISPNDSEVNFINAKILIAQKKYEGAIISLRKVVADDPENIEAYILLSIAQNSIGEKMSAIETMNRAYENNRANTKGLLALAQYHAKNNNKSDLESVIDKYLLIDADNYQALSYKSALLTERKMFLEAQPFVKRLIELYPDLPNGYIQSVPYLLETNKISEAINVLDTGYEIVNDNNRIIALLVSLHASMKDFDVAISKVESAIREKGETAELYMLLAKTQIVSGNKDDAKISLIKARDIKPDWNEPYLMLSDIYISNKQAQKSIEVLQQGLITIKNDLKLSLNLAKIYEGLGDYELAISEYEKSYERHRDNLVLSNNLASLLSEHRDDNDSLTRAKELADKLKTVDNAVILDTVGWVYYKIGDYAGAVSILKTVVDKSPSVAVFNYHLGMALYKTGDEAAARNYLTNAVANNSSFSGKAEAEAQLKKLQ